MEERKPHINGLKRIWKKRWNPYRSFVLWGWNEQKEPSFLILYGIHQFQQERSYFEEDSDIERFENVLCDEVTYTSYAIFHGKEGHLPSFESVHIVNEASYYYDGDKEDFPKMFYKKDSRWSGWNWQLKEEGVVQNYRKIKEGGITLPYFEEISYEALVQKVLDSSISFDGFQFAKNPNEILNLLEGQKTQYERLCMMLGDKNLYMRKKMLKELLDSTLEKEVYDCIFKVGSVESISGLLLECAKRRIDWFIKEAKYICENEIHYAQDSYVKGLKRCATIYLNAVIKERREKREQWIYEHISEIDLPLIKIDGKEIAEHKVMTGIQYRMLANQGKLQEYSYDYHVENGRWVSKKIRNEGRYQKGFFNDGIIFDIMAFKNVLQEAEAYKMADVIGKIAYYLDAPRLHYYFMGNGLSRILKYFKRYVRRILEEYAKNEPDLFMKAMKSLLTSYTKADMLCKFKDNFQFNYFIKNFLYYDFKEKAPIGWDNWRERENWMRNDQLLALEGRYEFMKAVWDQHLEDVLFIVVHAKLETIHKACYFILRESEKASELYEKMDYKTIIKLTEVTYAPLAEIFIGVLKNRLLHEKEFHFTLMIDMLDSGNEYVNQLGVEYQTRLNGYATSSDLIELMLTYDLEKWKNYLVPMIQSINPEQYPDFVTVMLKREAEFTKRSVKIPEEISDVLSESVSNIMKITKEERTSFLKSILPSILKKGGMANFVEKFLEEVIFEGPCDELKEVLENIELSTQNTKVSSRIYRIFALLDSIKQNDIPKDSAIIQILDMGTSKMVQALLMFITSNKNQLMERETTNLILLESNIFLLNEIAKEVFATMSEENKIKLHKMILDSPVKKVYGFGLEKLEELYGERIPAEFVMQMFEHPSADVKGYVSNKANCVLNTFGYGNEEIFLYYVKTLLLLPNRVRKNKEDVYTALYQFALQYQDRRQEVEQLLLDMGGSNIIKDREKALVLLAKIRKEATA